MSQGRQKFNPPPGWPKPPADWIPPKGWQPDPSWPKPPAGWQLWIEEGLDDPYRSQGDRPARAVGDPTDPSVATPPSDLNQRIAALEAENAALRDRLNADSGVVREIPFSDESVLQEVGIYRYHHPLENAVAYKERLDLLETRIAELIKTGAAIERSNLFTFDGSLAKGRKMTGNLAKLMLRAYNAEAENTVRSLRLGNVTSSKKRLEASKAAIANLGRMMEMRISDAFHALRIEEIELTADYLMKKQEEKEKERDERERLREERRVSQELAAERERLDKERNHLVTALGKLRALGSDDPDLERRLTEVDAAITQNDYRTANVRAGYIYVISNRGAFGESIVKIGLTRRLDPLERINELGDASVPFRFDVHALYFSEDAVGLENELHQHFSDRRVNWVNARREFFFASPAAVRDVLAERVGNLLEFTEHAESVEYCQSFRYWPRSIRTSSP